MQPRRREEHVTVSPASRAQHRLGVGPEPYRRTRRDGSDRETVHQRNSSPQKVDVPRRAVGANKGSDSFERRDYDWHLGGRRSSRVRSRSPPIEQARKRPHFDDGVRHRSCSPPLGLRPRYELSKTVEYNVDDKNLDAKRVYGYDHVNCRVNREKDLVESRLGGGQGMLNHKLMVHESEVQGSYRLVPDTGLTSQYEETGGQLPLLSRSVDVGRFEHERRQHRDPLSSDKGVDKTILHAREVSCTTVSPSYTKDFASTSQLRDYGSSSLEMSRNDFLCSHRDDIHLPTYYELSRSSGKLTEPVGFSGYGQRPLIDTTRGPETGQRNIRHQRCPYSPTRTEHDEYLNSKLQVAAQDGNQYDDLHRRIAPHGRLDYEQAQMEYNNREISRPYIVHSVLDRTGKGEDSYGNHRSGTINEHPALQKPKYFNYPDMNRTLIASKQGEEYLGSGYDHIEIERRMPQEYEVSYLGVSEADRVSILRSEYESRREGGPGQQERFRSNPLSKHNSETNRHAARVQEIKQDLSIHDQSDRFLRRKYNANQDISMCDPRTVKSRKWDALEEFHDLHESEDWIDDEEMNVLYSSGNVGFDHKVYRKDKREYNGLDSKEDFPSDDWLSSQDSLGYAQQRSFRFHKYSGQNAKSHPRSNSSSWYKSQHFSKRNAIHKPKVWKKYHGYDENVPTNNDESAEDWINATEFEPSEGSEEFNQMVHEAFLMYSKKLNVNSSVQRRYKEQGNAGSLYCIVCGKSSSKEFMDTQRLVTHAFMSHKAGLRAKHLGLHKAICVLLGWDIFVPQDTVTWVPQVLPSAEALAQKEDLILWPPVVIIHNVSMSDDNPQKWKVVSIETIEAFLRGKGFVRGRIKLCLGKPADQSVILVKFLGTFVGLGDAERLHKYLSGSNRGRVEYERLKSKASKCSIIDETEAQGDKVESILYGYMGISDDLDKLDFNTKKWSLIKSRKDIEHLDKDPVKPNERQ